MCCRARQNTAQIPFLFNFLPQKYWMMKYFCRFRYAASLCPVSRVRRIRSSLVGSAPEAEYMRLWEETTEWSHAFWLRNNVRFEQFVAVNGTGQAAYRQYLVAHQKEFAEYNREWYRRNLLLLYMDLKAKWHRILNA